MRALSTFFCTPIFKHCNPQNKITSDQRHYWAWYLILLLTAFGRGRPSGRRLGFRHPLWPLLPGCWTYHIEAVAVFVVVRAVLKTERLRRQQGVVVLPATTSRAGITIFITLWGTLRKREMKGENKIVEQYFPNSFGPFVFDVFCTVILTILKWVECIPLMMFTNDITKYKKKSKVPLTKAS